MPGGRPKSDTKQRFLAKVKKVKSGCHEWQAGLHRDGYGKFRENGTIQAHRMAYMLFVGEIPDDGWVLHTCDNRKCVNPRHLFIGTPKDNIADMDAKHRRGTKSQLTYADVEEIKNLLNERFTQQYIAQKFGVDQTTVSRIKRGITKIFKEN